MENGIEFESKVTGENPDGIAVDENNIKELLKSKNFKIRIKAYESVSNFPEYLSLLQNETNIPALEVALDVLLSTSHPLSNDDISKLYSMFSQSKTTIRNKIESLIDKIYESNKDSVIIGISSQLDSKNMKVVEILVNKLNDLLKREIESKSAVSLLKETVCPKLEMLFGSTDPNVKKNTVDLCVTIYQTIFDDIYKFIGNIKPIILNDLKGEFSKYSAPKKELKISSMNFEDPNWKERLNSVNALKGSSFNPNSFDIINIIGKLLKDPNIQVVTATVECIREGKIINPDVIKGMILHFKDKKQNLNKLIKDAVSDLNVPLDILYSLLDNKNPDIKIGVLECLLLYKNHKNIKELGKLLEDGNPTVREKAALILINSNSLSDLSEAHRAKLSKNFSGLKGKDSLLERSDGDKNANRDENPPAGESYQRGSTSLDTPNVNSSESRGSLKIKGIENEKQEDVRKNSNLSSELNSNDLSIDESERNKIVSAISNKYPFLLDKDWNKRMDGIKNSKSFIKEPSKTIIQFLILCKESNYMIIKELLLILLERQDLDSISSEICAFFNTKITEDKLKDVIISIYKMMDYNCVIDNIINNIKKNKTGKKFIVLIEILGNIIKEKDEEIDQFINDCKGVYGIQEKKALIEFIEKYNKISVKPKQNSAQRIVYNNSELRDSRFNQGSNSEKYQNAINKDIPVQVSSSNQYENCFNKDFSNNKCAKNNDYTDSNFSNHINNNKCAKNNDSKNQFINNCISNNDNKNHINNNMDQLDVKEAYLTVDKNDQNKCKSKYQEQEAYKSVEKSLSKADQQNLIVKILKNTFGSSVEECFTEEYLNIAKKDPYTAIKLLEDLDFKSNVPNIIRLYIYLELPCPYFNSLILHLISSKYILDELEVQRLCKHLIKNNMGGELQLLDRVYPVTKLFKIYKYLSIDYKGALYEIKKILMKYKKTVASISDDKLYLLIEKSEEFLDLVSSIEQTSSGEEDCGKKSKFCTKDSTGRLSDNENSEKFFKTKANDQSKELSDIKDSTEELSDYEDSFIIANSVVEDFTIEKNEGEYLKAPSVLEDTFTLPGVPKNPLEYQKSTKNEIQQNSSALKNQIESSFKNPQISFNEENKEFNSREIKTVHNSPMIKPPSVFNEFHINENLIEKSLENISISTTPRKKKRNLNQIEDILSKLIHSDNSVSIESFERLNEIISENISSLIFSSNSIVGSAIIQLFDKFQNKDFRILILNTLLRLSQSVEYCHSLRQETIKSINSDLIRIVPQETTAADILINLCLNCKPSILAVYFDLLDIKNEIILKLIWRHSKRIDYNSKDVVFSVVKIVDEYYNRKSHVFALSDNVTMKVCLLHLKECCLCYSDGIKSLGLSNITKSIVDILVGNAEFSLDSIRALFK